MTSSRLVIIGGSDAGISAALRARELDPAVDVTVLVADAYPNFSICGLPYFLAGDVPDWRSLAHRGVEELRATGMELLLEHTARSIEPGARTVAVTDAAGRETELAYDRLIVATGATPVLPPIEGLHLPGVHVLHTMQDAFSIQEMLEERGAESVLVVGAGYIGLEMVEAFASRGLTVTVVEQLEEILPTIDPELGGLLRKEIANHGVDVVTGARVESIQQKERALVVRGTSGLERTVDLVLVVVGVKPDTDLASGAGAKLGTKGAIEVD